MSYATMQDVSFALELTDRELPDQPREHSNMRASEPESPKHRGEVRRAAKRESKRKPSAKRAA